MVRFVAHHGLPGLQINNQTHTRSAHVVGNSHRRCVGAAITPRRGAPHMSPFPAQIGFGTSLEQPHSPSVLGKRTWDAANAPQVDIPPLNLSTPATNPGWASGAAGASQLGAAVTAAPPPEPYGGMKPPPPPAPSGAVVSKKKAATDDAARAGLCAYLP